VTVAPFDDETGAVVELDVDVGVEDDVDVDVELDIEDEELPVVRLVDVAAVRWLVAAAVVSEADEEARKAKAPVRANPPPARRTVRVLTRRRPAASLGDGGLRCCPIPTS
jgi:hypothetical protein